MLVFGAVASAQEPRPLPELAAATRIVAADSDTALDWPALLERLASVDAVFVGETHLDDTTHRAQLFLLEQLLQRRAGKVVLSLEMFERDVQPVLDAYLRGEIDEAAFLLRARPWGNYRTDYRPLIECAKANRIPVVAANFPSTLRRRLGGGGEQAFLALPPEQRKLLPETILPASKEYWERVDRAVRGHAQMGVAAGDGGDRRYDTQNLWDNAMGDAVAKARKAHPDHLVLHIAGGFHVAYRDGTVAQFLQRCPDQKAVVVALLPTGALHRARPDRDRPQADYLVYALSIARSEHEERFAVDVPAELRYRLHVPRSAEPLPLLVWLPDRRSRPEDALAFWTRVLGDGAAVAVVEPPFPELQDDLAAGGRFVFGDGFRADYGRAQHGVEQLVEYVTRRLPVAGDRVVVAGDGDGGAVVAWLALYGQWLAADCVAIEPRDLTRLRFEALPDQSPVTRSLCLVDRGSSADKLEALAGDYRKVAVPTEVRTVGATATPVVDLLRARLGLPATAAPQGEPVWVVLDHDLPRAREWGELYAARLRAEGAAAVLVTAAALPQGTDPAQVRRLRVGDDGAFPMALFQKGRGLPLAGGSFGGTTVLVLPKGTTPEQRAAFVALEQGRAIKQRSMFANLAIANVDQEPTLPAVLADLKQRGRSRMVVVPAVFCADAATMQELRRQADAVAQDLDLWWLPGLGAELVR